MTGYYGTVCSSPTGASSKIHSHRKAFGSYSDRKQELLSVDSWTCVAKRLYTARCSFVVYLGWALPSRCRIDHNRPLPVASVISTS